MKPVWAVLLAATLTAGGAMPHMAQADEDEKVVSLNQIPAAARTALLREAGSAPILRVEVEQEDGKTVYEGVIKQGDSEVGIDVDAHGKVLGRHLEKTEKDEHN